MAAKQFLDLRRIRPTTPTHLAVGDMPWNPRNAEPAGAALEIQCKRGSQ
jgi:hypothetical protein